MQEKKLIEFNGTPGGYFLVVLIAVVGLYIPFFGWAFAFNYSLGWFAESSKVNGSQLVYKATFGEALKFVFISFLLLAITFGIYLFWLAPKAYRFFADHTESQESASAFQPPTPQASFIPPAQQNVAPVDPIVSVSPVQPPAPSPTPQVSAPASQPTLDEPVQDDSSQPSATPFA